MISRKARILLIGGPVCLCTYLAVRTLMPGNGLKAYGKGTFEEEGTPTLIAGAGGADAGGFVSGDGAGSEFTMDASTAEFFGGNFAFVVLPADDAEPFSTAFSNGNGDAAYLDEEFQFGGGDGKESKDVIGEGKESKDVIGEGPFDSSSPGLTSVPLITLTGTPDTSSPPDEDPPTFDTPEPPDTPDTPDTPDIPDTPIPEPATALFGVAITAVLGFSRRRR